MRGSISDGMPWTVARIVVVVCEKGDWFHIDAINLGLVGPLESDLSQNVEHNFKQIQKTLIVGLQVDWFLCTMIQMKNQYLDRHLGDTIRGFKAVSNQKRTLM